MTDMADVQELGEILGSLRQMQEGIRDRVLAACESQSAEELSAVSGSGGGDTIFAVDRVGEAELVEFLERELASRYPLVLIAEGLDAGGLILPRGTREADARWRLIADPIDGTRCVMYQKRSGWILTGVAPNRGPQTSLSDIVIAVQTEIPLVKQHLGDQLWAIRGHGAGAERIHRFSGERRPLPLRPSRSSTLRHGYASLSRFFPGGRDVLAAIDEELVRRLLGPPAAGDAQVFEDQYPCTGGQLYGLVTGQDRFLADLRPLLQQVLAERGQPLGHCCHPYDICTSLIAQEMDVPLTAPDGGPLDCRLELDLPVGWVGYANVALQRQIEPVLLAVLREFGLLVHS